MMLLAVLVDEGGRIWLCPVRCTRDPVTGWVGMRSKLFSPLIKILDFEEMRFYPIIFCRWGRCSVMSLELLSFWCGVTFWEPVRTVSSSSLSRSGFNWFLVSVMNFSSLIGSPSFEIGAWLFLTILMCPSLPITVYLPLNLSIKEAISLPVPTKLGLLRDVCRWWFEIPESWSASLLVAC